MSKLIVVVGVTGVQGSSVAEMFLRLPGWKVRGITRNPSGTAAQTLAANGVEVVKGDLDDIKSLLSAFEGAAVIFSNPDFFGHLFQVLATNDSLGGRTPLVYAYDREVEQGIRIAEAAASPTVLKTLELFIFSSLVEARKWSNGKYAHVYHYDSKAEIVRLIKSRFPEVAARMSTLIMGHYVTNWKMFPPMVPKKQSDGSYKIQRTFSPAFVMPFVVPHKDAGAFVKALTDLPPGKSLLGVSKHMTWPEWTKLWGDTLRVKATFERVSFEEHFKGQPDVLKEEFIEAFEFAEEFGFFGGDPEVLTAQQLGIEIPVTSLEEYIKSEDWSSVLQG